MVTKTEAPKALKVISEGIPDYLTRRPQFVGWKAEPKPDGRLDKIPMIAGTNRRASTTDLLTWRSFKEACGAYEAGKHDGIGFVFCSADPFVGIDLDDCRGPKSGKITPWAQSIINRVQEGYIEASPSGTGVHIIVEGRVRDGGMRKGPIEMYSRERFFTITGEIL